MMTIVKETQKNVMAVAGVTVIGGVAIATEINDMELMKLSKRTVDLIIPEGVEEVKPYAFCNCKVTSVKLPKSLKRIGACAFKGNKLTEVELPEWLEEIEMGAFRDNNLTEIELPDNLKIIGESAFRSNNLEEAEVNKALRKIGDRAFATNPLKSVNLEGHLVEIGVKAFETEGSDFSIKLPVNLKKLGRGAFSGNTTNRLEMSEGTLERLGEKNVNRAFAKGRHETTEVDVVTYKDFKITSRAFAYRGGLISIEAKLESNVLSMKNKGGDWESFDLTSIKDMNDLELIDILRFTDCGDTYEEIHYTYKNAGEAMRYQSDFKYENGKVEGWLEHIDLIDVLTEETISHYSTVASRKTMRMFIERIK